MFLVFGLMYFHAIRRRESLNLSEDDVFYAVEHVAECGVMVTMGLISIVLAQTLPFAVAAPAAGFVYMFIAPLQWWRSVWMNKKRPQILLRVLT